jgi:hypothetical protein
MILYFDIYTTHINYVINVTLVIVFQINSNSIRRLFVLLSTNGLLE